MKGLTDLEQALMTMLLSGDHPVLSTLRTQANRGSLRLREPTGAGFYCHFDVPDDAPLVADPEDFEICDVLGQIAGLAHGAGFVLFIRRGRLDFLEAFSFDERWPDHVADFTLTYESKNRSLPGG